MPSFCVVHSCEFKYVHSPNISFHKFPFHTESLLQQWIQFTGRGEFWLPSRWSSICSRHFLPNDFRDHVYRKCLKRNAVPSVTIKSLDCTSIVRAASNSNFHPNELIHIHQNLCRLCARKTGTGGNSRTRRLDDPLVAAALYKCCPTIPLDLDDTLPQTICSDCASQLNRFATFVDRVVSVQADLLQRYGCSEHIPEQADSSLSDVAHHNKKGFKIKQEPFVNVKQEIDTQTFHYTLPESDAFCEFCDAYFINNLELKNHIVKYHSGNNDRDQAPNNCEIMEIITLGNAFINLAEEDNNVGGGGGGAATATESPIDAHHSDMIPLEQVLKVEHFNEYEQREQRELMVMLQSIVEEHSYYKVSGHNDSANESNDHLSSYDAIAEEASHFKLEPIVLQPVEAIPEVEMSIVDSSHSVYQCNECPDYFTSQSNLDDHIVTHSNQSTPAQRTHCTPCSLQFDSHYEYMLHRQQIHRRAGRSIKPGSCPDCSMRFATKLALNNHKRFMCSVRRGLTYKCRYCRRNFAKWSQMREHGKVCENREPLAADASGKHTDERMNDSKGPKKSAPSNCTIVNGRFACLLCDRTYGRRSNLNRHVLLHRPRDQWTSQCPHCHRLFDRDHDVSIHLRDLKCSVQPSVVPATASPLFVCSKCSFEASSQQQLVQHLMAAHSTTAKSFACASCSKRFRCAQNLRQHQATHGAERKFACTMCDKTFKRVAGLNQHVNGFHYKIKRHVCPVCKYSYALKGDMKRCRHSTMAHK